MHGGLRTCSAALLVGEPQCMPCMYTGNETTSATSALMLLTAAGGRSSSGCVTWSLACVTTLLSRRGPLPVAPNSGIRHMMRSYTGRQRTPTWIVSTDGLPAPL